MNPTAGRKSMIIQGYIPNWSHADAMTAYMKLNGIRIFDYPDFSRPLTEQDANVTVALLYIIMPATNNVKHFFNINSHLPF